MIPSPQIHPLVGTTVNLRFEPRSTPGLLLLLEPIEHFAELFEGLL